MIKEPICFFCKHFIEGKDYKCQAFPDGIPNDILFDKNDHSKPLPDQKNEIVFEKKEKD